MSEEEREKEKVYYYFKHQSLFESFISDLITFGFLLGSFYLNERFVGGSKILAGLLVILFVLFAISKVSSSKRIFHDKEKMIEYIRENE